MNAPLSTVGDVLKRSVDRQRERMKSRIVAVNICPPIPLRQCDWMAHYDGQEECGPFGYGETADAAVADLLDNYDYPERTIEDLGRMTP